MQSLSAYEWEFYSNMGGTTGDMVFQSLVPDNSQRREIYYFSREVASMSYQVPRGTVDLLPDDTRIWKYVERVFHSVCERFNYHEIRTPMFEQTELFVRSVGETSDIVTKEMYTFEDRGGRSLTLRPEGTAPVVRSYVENKMYGDPNQPVKLYYAGPMFRYERPQAGRQRQFHQFGVEAIGSSDPSLDAEVIALAWTFFQELSIGNLTLEINSVGCSECRPIHRKKLTEYLYPYREELCKDCQTRLERNPLRVLDCKVDRCKEIVKDAPSILDHLCEECTAHFTRLQSELNSLEIPFEVNPNLVRGLDYYTRTAFEFMEASIGAKSTVCGGGRYNGLVQEFGGPEHSGIGFGLGVERLMLAIKTQGIQLPVDSGIDVYVIALGEKATAARTRIIYDLRSAGLKVDTDYMERKMKAQIKAADRLQAKYALILGDDELNKGAVLMKDLASGEQQEVEIAHLVETCKKAVKKNLS